MFRSGDYAVVSGYGVCYVDSVGHPKLSCADPAKNYYTLNHVSEKCTIYIPCDADDRIRPIITKGKAISLIKAIPVMRVKRGKDKHRVVRYREALADGRPEALLPIIMEIYEANSSSLGNGRPIGNATEASIFREAEMLFNSELAYALGCYASDVPKIIETVTKGQSAESNSFHDD